MDIGNEIGKQAATPKAAIAEEKMQGQEAMTVSPKVLLAQLVSFVGEEFVVIPTGGWMAIVETLQNIDKAKPEDRPESILEVMEGLGVPVVPVSLCAKEEESNIIMPNDVPEGESRIIMP